MHRRFRDRRGGFTMVELLIVLGILVMLFAIVGPRVLKSGKKADANVAKAQIAAFKPMLEHYHIAMKTFPSSEQGLDALYAAPEDLGENAAWDGPYGDGDDVPTDPWGNAYQYAFPSAQGERDFPDIWSMGPDGEDGTEDDICNWSKDDASQDEASP